MLCVVFAIRCTHLFSVINPFIVIYRYDILYGYVEYYEYPIFHLSRFSLLMTFRKPINFSRDVINKRKELLNNKKLRIRLN